MGTPEVRAIKDLHKAMMVMLLACTFMIIGLTLIIWSYYVNKADDEPKNETYQKATCVLRGYSIEYCEENWTQGRFER
jgi:heme/copper-type cytochrome/quinol oxidase subunit 2